MPYLHVALAFLFALVVPTGRAEAGVPTDQLKQHVDEVVRQMEDPALQASPAQRRVAVRRISEQIFDYKETARRALGRHWNARTPQEREEFVRLFADLLDRAYFSRIDQYKGERVRYADETIDGAEAVVKTVIVTGRGSEVPVDYRMRLADGRWRVYDVNVEGVSLVANYRTQFNKIVETESYESLVRKLRAREASPAASGRSDRPLTQR
ncbi:MAG TPA: ABC transporter substrate-binding protein [Methylomirabilota bacterium]|nr:ABC transporter substrate-binding protein [Methylomirabilota bacterium]